MSNWNYAQVVPTSPWRSSMTLPRELTLRETDKGTRLVSQPVREVGILFEGSSAKYNGIQQGATDLSSEATDKSTYELKFSNNAGNNPSFSFTFSNRQNQKLVFSFDSAINEFSIDRSHAQNNGFSDDFAKPQVLKRELDGPVRALRIFVDVASIEIFADDGLSVMTSLFFPESPFTKVELQTSGEIEHVEITELKSIWK